MNNSRPDDIKSSRFMDALNAVMDFSLKILRFRNSCLGSHSRKIC